MSAVDPTLRARLFGACIRCVGDDPDGCVLGTRYRYAKDPPPNGSAATLGPCICGCHRPDARTLITAALYPSR